MSWIQARTRWPLLSQQLCNTFRHLDPVAMIRCRGDRYKLNFYLAQTHDLTLEEATQALDDWLAFSASTSRLPTAA